MRRRILPLTLLTAFILSACGVKGDLETAPPMWGDKAKQDQPVKAPEPSADDAGDQSPEASD